MGQYWKVVNLDKKEFVNPHKLGCGLKLWEQLANSPGVGQALIVLQAAMPEARGGGDFTLDSTDEAYNEIAKRTIGRWAGDRVVLVGDYAEDSDLPRRQKASAIYGLCMSKDDWKESLVSFYRAIKKLKAGTYYSNPISSETTQQYIRENEERIKYYKEYVWFNLYTEISDDVAKVIEFELNGKYTGDGWKEWHYNDKRER